MVPLTDSNTILDRVANLPELLSLYDTLPTIYFFMKDAEGRFIKMNRALLTLFDLEHEKQILGKTDFDFFDADLAERYREEDQQVMQQKRAVRNRVWIVPDQEGVVRWFVSSKIPLLDDKGRAIGIAGAMRDGEQAGAVLAPYQRLAEAIRHMHNHVGEKIHTQTLARLSRLSVSQFNRQFRKLFQMTPAHYLTQVRINAARQALIHSEVDLNHIARACGFVDGSHLIKRFRSITGMTPAEYRRRHSAST